jgi:hypothetical protein
MTLEEFAVFSEIAKPILEAARNDIDYYAGTIYEGFLELPNTVRGSIGEHIVSADMASRGHVVQDRTSAGHDRIIDGIKTEIKHAIQGKFGPDSHILNHISADKDWDRLVFYGVNRPLENMRRVWFTKEDFLANIDCGIFRRQQGGADLENDDYMCSKTPLLLNQPWVHDIKDW